MKKDFHCSAKQLHLKPHHLHRPCSSKDNKSQRFVFQQISFLQLRIKNIVKTFRDGSWLCSGNVAREQQDNQGFSPVRLTVICKPPSLRRPPVVINGDYGLLGCFRSLMWSAALQRLEALQQTHKPSVQTWTEAGTQERRHRKKFLFSFLALLSSSN